jgi:hypothetical protein
MIKPNSFAVYPNKPPLSLELSRILTAAVVNSRFRSLLLNDPISAIEIGYSDESFSIGADEKERLGAIHVSSLSEFAAQLSAI